MKHLRIEVIGQRIISRPYYNVQMQGTLIHEYENHPDSEPILRVEIDKESWDAMFDLYEAHMRGFQNPTVQDAWDQYVMTLHLCGEQNHAGHKTIRNYKL